MSDYEYDNDQDYVADNQQDLNEFEDEQADDRETLAREMGTHQYMPKEFLGLQTKDLGFFIVGKKTSPFMELKEKIMNEGTSLKVEDRMQAVRMLCSIPYNNATYHCVEAAMTIIKDPSIDIYKRFYFFSNKEKYFRLDDHVVNYLYPAFFKYGLKEGPVAVPFELMLMSAKYLLQAYGEETSIRKMVVDYLLDIVDNKNNDEYTRVQVLDLLLSNGNYDEQMFANEELDMLDIDNPKDYFHENFETDLLARDILRYLRTTYTVDPSENPEPFFVELVRYANAHMKDKKLLGWIEEFFTQDVSGPAQYECIPFEKICVLVYKEICSNRKGSSHMADECIRRMVEMIHNGYDTSLDMILNTITVLEGVVTPKKLSLEPSVFECLRNEVFAALNRSVASLNPGLRAEVEASRESEDKSAAREFLIYFDDERELLQREFVKKVSLKEFNEMFDKIVEEWIR